MNYSVRSFINLSISNRPKGEPICSMMLYNTSIKTGLDCNVTYLLRIDSCTLSNTVFVISVNDKIQFHKMKHVRSDWNLGLIS